MLLSKAKLLVPLFRPFSTKTVTSSSFKSNISPNIQDKMNRKLYQKSNHPLCLLKQSICSFLQEENRHKWSKTVKIETNPEIFEDLDPIVSVKECFDDLLVPEGHETRLPKNTYYHSEDRVLRTHMTTHDVDLIRKGKDFFFSIGDVYRRDSIDSTHYPVFHQIDGVRMYKIKDLPSKSGIRDFVLEDLKFFLSNFSK